MLTTTTAFKTAIDADTREFRFRASVYFDGESEAPTVFDQDDIVSAETLEESSSDTGNPAGKINSNEIVFVFDNVLRNFTPTNSDGAYYGKLHPGTKVVSEQAIKLAGGAWEYVPMGTYWTSDWDAPSDSVEASVACYDRLKAIGNMDVPLLPVMQNTTIGTMFAVLFDALGVTDYEIDPALTQSVRFGWFPAGKVFDALEQLSVAGYANVYVDRNNVIQVRSCANVEAYVAEMNDSNQIISANNPQNWQDVYSSVNLQYKTPSTQSVSTLLEISDLVIPPEGLVLTDLNFNNSPVFYIASAQVTGAVTAYLYKFNWGAWGCRAEFLSGSETNEIVQFSVTGRHVDFLSSTLTVTDATALAMIGAKELKVDNPFIQNANYATDYANKLLQLVASPSSKVAVNVRGNLAIELKDAININDVTDKIGPVEIVPYRIKLKYDGGLSGSIEGRKASLLEVI